MRTQFLSRGGGHRQYESWRYVRMTAGVVALCGAIAFSVPPRAATAATSTKASTQSSKATRTTTRPAQVVRWRKLTVNAAQLSEVSGCAVSRSTANRVWVHNDAGDGAFVIPVDLDSGAVGKPVTLSGVDVVDPEDLAATKNGDLVLADIGDNAERRSSVQLYRFPEPTNDAPVTRVTRFDLRYPDGPHNAEGLVVSSDGRTALIFTKSATGVSGVYKADLSIEPSTGPSTGPSRSGPQVMSRVGTVKISGETHAQPNIITAADLSDASNGSASRIVLRTFARGYSLAIPRGNNMIESALRSVPVPFAVPSMVQGEALCVAGNGSTLVTASESRGASTFALAVGAFPR